MYPTAGVAGRVAVLPLGIDRIGPVIYTSVPKYAFFATANPPEVVNEPPLVEEVASVVLVIEIAPLEDNPVNVPTDVIFGCAAVCNVPVL